MLGGMFKIMAAHNAISAYMQPQREKTCLSGDGGGLRKTKAQTDQHLCYSLIGKHHISDLLQAKFNFLPSLCS